MWHILRQHLPILLALGLSASILHSCAEEPMGSPSSKEQSSGSDTPSRTKPTKPSDPTQPATRPSQIQLLRLIERAAERIADEKSKRLSPNTRYSYTWQFDEEKITYDDVRALASIELKVSWKAKQYLLSLNYLQAEVTGTLYVNYALRPTTYAISFIPEKANDFARWLGESKALASISFNLN